MYKKSKLLTNIVTIIKEPFDEIKELSNATCEMAKVLVSRKIAN